jgi:hypothetical protein
MKWRTEQGGSVGNAKLPIPNEIFLGFPQSLHENAGLARVIFFISRIAIVRSFDPKNSELLVASFNKSQINEIKID